MFLLISWRWVVNVVAVIASTRIAATICTASDRRLRVRNVAEIGIAPNSSALPKLFGQVVGQERRAPSPFVGAWSSSRNSARKIGICSRIGRQEANGLVPVSL